MEPEIILGIVGASISLLTLCLTSLLTYRTIIVQQRIGLNPLQKDYLFKKLEKLEFVKSELDKLDATKTKNQELNTDNLTTNIALYANSILSILPKQIYNVSGYISDTKLYNISIKIQKLNELMGKLRYETMSPQKNKSTSFNLDEIFECYKEFKDVVIKEICSTRIKIQGTFKM